MIKVLLPSRCQTRLLTATPLQLMPTPYRRRVEQKQVQSFYVCVDLRVLKDVEKRWVICEHAKSCQARDKHRVNNMTSHRQSPDTQISAAASLSAIRAWLGMSNAEEFGSDDWLKGGEEHCTGP
jgi:hypothetical protein